MTAEELFQGFLDKHYRSVAIRTIGIGTAVEIQENNCTVLRDGQPELLDVRFHATEATPGSRIIEIPADQSSVIYAIIDNQDTEAVILRCSEVDKVLMVIGDLEYHIDKDGVMISCGNDSLGEVLTGVIEEVKKIIVVNGRSPNVPALNILKTKLNKILK